MIDIIDLVMNIGQNLLMMFHNTWMSVLDQCYVSADIQTSDIRIKLKIVEKRGIGA